MNLQWQWSFRGGGGVSGNASLPDDLRRQKAWNLFFC